MKPKLFVQTTKFMLNICFPSGFLEFSYVPGKGYLLLWSGSNKNPGYCVPNKLLAWQHFTYVVSNHSGGIKLILCDSPGRGPLEALPGPRPMCLFSMPILLCILLLQYIIAVSVTICSALWVLLENHRTWRWSWGSLDIIQTKKYRLWRFKSQLC